MLTIRGLTFGAAKAEAASIDKIKQQVKEAAEHRSTEDDVGSNPSPGSFVPGKFADPNAKANKSQGNQTLKKPHVVVVKQLGSWWNGKVVLESRDGLWVLVIK
jgi:hypothetical protein